MQRIRVRVQQLGDRHFLISFSSRVAIITQSLLKAGKGGRMARVKAGYFGFESFDDAQAFADSVRRRYSKARLQVRAGKRLAMAFEVKVSHSAIEQIVSEQLQQVELVSDRIDAHIRQHQRFTSMPANAVDFDNRHSSMSVSRSAGRKTMTGRAGITVGIE